MTYRINTYHFTTVSIMSLLYISAVMSQYVSSALLILDAKNIKTS
jgi:hypothetical protein